MELKIFHWLPNRFTGASLLEVASSYCLKNGVKGFAEVSLDGLIMVEKQYQKGNKLLHCTNDPRRG